MSGLNGFCKCLKFMVLIVNFIISLAGIGVIVLGAKGLVLSKNYSFNDSQILFYAFIVIVILGVMLSVIGLIGCCGAAMENQCLLGTLVMVMSVALALDIAGAIMLPINKDEIQVEARKGIEKIFHSAKLEENFDLADKIQLAFHCCGANRPSEWLNLQREFPHSCCKEEITSDLCVRPPSFEGRTLSNSTTIYYKPCLTAVKETISSVLEVAPIVLGVVGVFEVLSLVAALSLCCAIRKASY